jgi:hypothetical protein
MLPILLAQLASLGANLAFAFAAILLWWAALRFLDVLAGGWTHFKGQGGPLARILSDPRAAADYYGKRNIAAALLVGLVLATVRF